MNSNYQYKAFGVPWLGLKRGLGDEAVVSSYGTVLAITDFPKEVVQNLKILEKQGMYGEYGFYESIDYTPTRLKVGENHAIVETYMAHHQALILLSINNLINDDILQKRFMGNPEMQAIDILLQERMPSDMLITKDKKEKTKKIKYTGYNAYIETVYTKPDDILRKCNVLSNENYMICTDDRGKGWSSYKNILIYKDEIEFSVKNMKNGYEWKLNYEKDKKSYSKYEVTFSEDTSKFLRVEKNIETEMKIFTPQNLGTEIRNIIVKNNSEESVVLEISSYIKPVLARKEDYIAHPAFNNLFLQYSVSEDGDFIVKKNKRGAMNEVYLGVNLFVQGEENEKLSANGNAIDNPCIQLKRQIELGINQEKMISLIISVSDNLSDVTNNLMYCKSEENINRELKIARVKAEEEARYLGATTNDLEIYQKILPYIMYQNPMKASYMNNLPKKEYKQCDFWKYGISGDLPVILVTVKSAGDIYIVKEMLKAHEYLRAKGILTDLVILDYEKNIYEQYVKEQVIQEILNMQIGYLQNVSSGIFLLNVNEISDADLFMFKANLVIEAGKTLAEQL